MSIKSRKLLTIENASSVARLATYFKTAQTPKAIMLLRRSRIFRRED
jgi:hypothetical protein